MTQPFSLVPALMGGRDVMTPDISRHIYIDLLLLLSMLSSPGCTVYTTASLLAGMICVAKDRGRGRIGRGINMNFDELNCHICLLLVPYLSGRLSLSTRTPFLRPSYHTVNNAYKQTSQQFCYSARHTTPL